MISYPRVPLHRAAMPTASLMNRHSRLAGAILLLVPLAALTQEAATPVTEPTPAPVTATEPELPALVRVSGVETLADYATVGRLLSAANGVRRVDVTEAEGSTVTFRVLVRGGSAALDRSLESAGPLVRSGASGGRLIYELRR